MKSETVTTLTEDLREGDIRVTVVVNHEDAANDITPIGISFSSVIRTAGTETVMAGDNPTYMYAQDVRHLVRVLQQSLRVLK